MSMTLSDSAKFSTIWSIARPLCGSWASCFVRRAVFSICQTFPDVQVTQAIFRRRAALYVVSRTNFTYLLRWPMSHDSWRRWSCKRRKLPTLSDSDSLITASQSMSHHTAVHWTVTGRRLSHGTDRPPTGTSILATVESVQRQHSHNRPIWRP